jgi:dCMP deaminase
MNYKKFIKVAKTISELSKDPRTKVGAICIDESGTILSTGYNGFPRGVHDTAERLNDRPTKNKFVVHAESNCIAQAARVGAKLLDSTIIVTNLFPCSKCSQLIINAGIKTIYHPIMDNNAHPEWHEEEKLSRIMFEEAGVELISYDKQDIL